MRIFKRWWALWGLGALGIALVFEFAIRPARLPYEFATVTRGDVIRSVRATGILKPIQLVQIGSEVSGQVESVSADLNAHVRRGQELARVSSTTLLASVRRAQAGIATAQAALAQREAEVQRAKRIQIARERFFARQSDLVRQGFISDAALDDAQLAATSARDDWSVTSALRDVARSDLQNARLGAQEASDALARSRIVSPLNGTVIARNVEPGQTIAATLQSPVLFEIADDLRHMRLEVKVDEADIGHVAIGQAVAFVVEAFPLIDHIARVTEIQRSAQRAEGANAFIVYASFENAQGQLMPGMNARVRIVTAERKGAIRIPSTALRFAPGPTPTSLLPRLHVVSKDEAARLQRSSAAPNEPSARLGTRVWRALMQDSAELEPVDPDLGLRGDDFVEILGNQLTVGDRLANRHAKR